MSNGQNLEAQLSATQQDLAALRRQLDDEVGALRQLLGVATQLNSTLNIQELLQLIISTAAELVGAEEGSLLLVDHETGELIFHVSSEETGKLVERRIPAGQGVAGWVVEHGESASIDDPARDERFYSGIDTAVGNKTRSLLAVPLAVKDRVLGVLEAINKKSGNGFSPSDLERAEALASLASVAIDNAQMYAKLTDAVVTARMSYRL
jgi:sigma-B regulation protein RsbU (phosphoserine phosphatase)